MSLLSAHVLDAGTGKPATGVEISLLTQAGELLDRAVTDTDGRVRELGPEALAPGPYQVIFLTGAYFAPLGRDTFFPMVTVHFNVVAGQPHYHVPLLLSQYSYTTYRGS